ncbi:uncharacterized protein LOC115974073 [Quercus lobata]|uniref:uncharacterized protein LOC115974073 n=1 Tax=Quercus lobata TaxID=97700 RepID=UPI001244C60F|nr:uncharacterized protein LOC115974073 [Quercus lobata]
MPKLSYSSPLSGEEKMLLHLEVAGKALYVLVLVVFLLLYLGEWKRNRRGGRHVQTTGRANFVGGDGDNGGETISGQIASEVHAIVDDTMGGQFAGEVRFDVAGDDDGGTISGKIAMIQLH